MDSPIVSQSKRTVRGTVQIKPKLHQIYTLVVRTNELSDDELVSAMECVLGYTKLQALQCLFLIKNRKCYNMLYSQQQSFLRKTSSQFRSLGVNSRVTKFKS